MKTVLFVDDEERVLDGLRRLIRSKSEEWESHFATSVDEAIGLLSQVSVDAIVTDLNMPGRSGMDLLKHVRSTSGLERLPCILLTGNGELQAKKDALEAGATDFLNKPIDFWELSVRIDNAVRLKQYQDEVLEQKAILNHRVQETTKELEYSRRLVLLRLALAAEWRDQNTGEHIVRVGLLSRLIANQLGFDEEDQARILLTSPLHDVGKIGLSDRILTGKSGLTPTDRLEMQNHCVAGYELLAGDVGTVSPLLATSSHSEIHSDLLDHAAVIALTHHERWDGSGYPRGLKGEEIPIEGRIVAVADVYDALRSRRPYKQALSMHQAAEIVKEGAGSHFDPKVADAFLERLDEAEAIIERYSDDDDGLLVA